MKQFVMLTALALMVVAVPVAVAGVIPQTETFSMPLSPNSTNLYFDQFNDLGGTRSLLSVTLEVEAEQGAYITGENDSQIPGSITAGLSGFVSGSGYGLLATALMSDSEGPVGVAATDGVPGSGPDYHEFGLVGGSGSDSDILTTGLAPFIGTGIATIEIVIAGEGGFVLSGVSDATITVSEYGTTGSATITYTYETEEVIPEPATLTLLAVGGLGLLLRRKRR